MDNQQLINGLLLTLLFLLACLDVKSGANIGWYGLQVVAIIATGYTLIKINEE